ncbi:MAG: hypothetical protein FWE57_08315 [Chitinispirillia bacterium]|nr:hypothetical protein [Chitinispirillia bacterium]
MSNEVRTKSADEAFCKSCGEIIKAAAEICVKCGVRQKMSTNNSVTFGTALLLFHKLPNVNNLGDGIAL